MWIVSKRSPICDVSWRRLSLSYAASRADVFFARTSASPLTRLHSPRNSSQLFDGARSVYLRRSESEAGLLVMAENEFSLNSFHSALPPSCAHVEERCKIIALQFGRGSWSARNQMAFLVPPWRSVCELWALVEHYGIWNMYNRSYQDKTFVTVNPCLCIHLFLRTFFLEHYQWVCIS